MEGVGMTTGQRGGLYVRCRSRRIYVVRAGQAPTTGRLFVDQEAGSAVLPCGNHKRGHLISVQQLELLVAEAARTRQEKSIDVGEILLDSRRAM
jgi:hypothetical protein